MDPKSASLSKVTMTQFILPDQAGNMKGNMHGAEVIKIMDNAAGVVGDRHGSRPTVTARIDKLIFREPVRVNNLFVCDAEIIYTGTTSMVIYVRATVEDLFSGESKPAADGYWLMIAVDEDGRPTPIPPLKIETMEQQTRFDYIGEWLNQIRKG